MDIGLKGKVVWVTGASSGIGEALAWELARQGARVVVTARRTDRLYRLVEKIRAEGGEALALACDVTKTEDQERVVAQALNQFQRLDVVVANAGMSVPGRLEDITMEEIRRQLETNLFGALTTAKVSLDALKRSRGRLVLMGSVMSYVSIPGHGPYSASKFALRAFAEALTPELLPAGVSVTLICPGFVESEIRLKDDRGHPQSDPMPSWLVMSREKAARQMVRVIARRRREVIVTGHGKLAVFLARHASWLIRTFLRRGVEWRQPPRSA